MARQRLGLAVTLAAALAVGGLSLAAADGCPLTEQQLTPFLPCPYDLNKRCKGQDPNGCNSQSMECAPNNMLPLARVRRTHIRGE